MIKTNRVSYDTCGCKLYFQWDDSLPVEGRTYTFLDVPTTGVTAKGRRGGKTNTVEVDVELPPHVTCPAHSNFTGQALWDRSQGENNRKNISRKLVRDFEGGFDVSLFTWQFVGENESRILQISHPDLTNQEKTRLQAAIDVRFGPGLVEVV